MTDTTKPQIDLSTLEQGDTVKFKIGINVKIAHVIKDSIGSFIVYMIIDNALTYYCYDKNGAVYNPNSQLDIIEIIKNPKRWTDEDMRKAWLAGSDPMDWDGNVYETFKEWLEQYKQVNHEQ